jgi:hypothetical protein
LASGVLNTSRQVGGSIGLAALATVATNQSLHVLRANAHQGIQYVSGASDTAPPHLLGAALTSGYTHAFGAAAVIAAIAAFAALAIPTVKRPTAPEVAPSPAVA